MLTTNRTMCMFVIIIITARLDILQARYESAKRMVSKDFGFKDRGWTHMKKTSPSGTLAISPPSQHYKHKN